MSYQAKAAILVEKGKFKRAIKLMTKAINADPDNPQLYRLRFEYGQYIPFDEMYHNAAEDFFRLLLDNHTSGNIIHDHYSVYLSTTQGRIGLSDDLLLELAAIFAGFSFENDAVYIINRTIRKSIKSEKLIDAIISLVNFYIDKGQKSKATQYVQYMIDFFPKNAMTRYIVKVYKQAE
jgi:tetratricopeptide (TPR) repeat protein